MAKPEVQVNPKKVVVIGGGVAGLTAAHELQERGFKVVVYERNTMFGGKARSFPVPEYYPEKVLHGLPAEHGFRFFPGFYKHLPNTLSRIPCPEPGFENRHVMRNLINVHRDAYAQTRKPFFQFPTTLPKTFGGLLRLITDTFGHPALGVPPNEAAFAAFKLVHAMTMCLERREEELDGRSWWNYMRADDMSPQYRSVIVNGLTQNFVAMDAKESSTKSVINILARLLNDFLRLGGTIDRVMDGPTSEVWIDPWVRYLQVERPGQTPVVFHTGLAVHSLVFDEVESRVTGIRMRVKNPPGVDDDSKKGSRGGPPIETDADFFVAAVPVEAMQRMLYHSPAAMQVHAPSLAHLNSDMLKTNWMSGVMYYLKEDETMKHTGHIVFLDTEWAVTAISQKQFWRKGVKDYGTGKVSGILSVILSDFETTGSRGKTAKQTDDRADLAGATLDQIRNSLLGTTLAKLDWHNNIAGFYVDPALKFKMGGLKPVREFAEQKASLRAAAEMSSGGPIVAAGMDPTPDEFIERNLEPLFINTVNSWQLRPDAQTEIGNLFLASDYVKTNTDLATMEGANEAARRAVNGILDALESGQRRCRIFEFDEPTIFAPLRAIDKWMYTIAGVFWNVAPTFSRFQR
jgi:uncharacterized protein with NAD-binding domain and iron-sulfur cluster